MIRVGTLALASVLGLGLSGGLAINNFAHASQPAVRTLDDDRHPEITRAMHSLHEARDALANAARDFDGHRKAALDATDAAIAECQKCMDIDH